jgi:hypothetical protein
MESVLIEDVLAKLPVPELDQSLATFLAPLCTLLPDRRLQQVVVLASMLIRTPLTVQA